MIWILSLLISATVCTPMMIRVCKGLSETTSLPRPRFMNCFWSDPPSHVKTRVMGIDYPWDQDRE